LIIVQSTQITRFNGYVEELKNIPVDTIVTATEGVGAKYPGPKRTKVWVVP